MFVLRSAVHARGPLCYFFDSEQAVTIEISVLAEGRDAEVREAHPCKLRKEHTR